MFVYPGVLPCRTVKWHKSVSSQCCGYGRNYYHNLYFQLLSDFFIWVSPNLLYVFRNRFATSHALSPTVASAFPIGVSSAVSFNHPGLKNSNYPCLACCPLSIYAVCFQSLQSAFSNLNVFFITYLDKPPKCA